MPLDQATRFLSVKVTGLPDNELLLTSFNGHEEMSRLFNFQLDMVSDNAGIEAKQVVGKNISFEVTLADDSARHFNGFISSFSAGDEDENGRREYSATVVPWLWFLTQTADCRIFQNQTVPQIIEQIFQDLGFSDYETSEIKGDHKQWEYCVQYRETDFNFVSRLLEQEGIFYFFRHADGKHMLVLADQKNAYEDCQENEVNYPTDAGGRAIADHITSWEHRYEFHSGKWAQTDFNFKTPSTSLMSQKNTKTDLSNIKKFEIYDYPGEYVDRGVGDAETEIRIEEEEVGYDKVAATSLCKTFTPGGKFKIKEHRASSEEGKTFAVVSIDHTAIESGAYETGAGEGAEEYSNSFTCIPDAVTFRPARITPKPLVSGVQTAVVVGPAGEEIYPDEFGRVKVQFHWDREGKKDENSSCWIRVSQVHAGKGWGGIDIPRIGEEVVVDFLEGDPDRPIIIGRVYHAENMPPYSLPDNKTQSGMKSRSSKGGSSDNFNEIRFEDKLGSEEMYIHAEKDQNSVVENNQTLLVGFDKADPGDQTIGVHNDRSESIGRDRKLTVGRDKFENVGQNKTIEIAQNHTEQVGADMNITVGSSLTESIALNYVETVGIAMQLSVGAALSITVGAAMAETVGGAKTETIGGAKIENIGAGKSVSVGKDFAQTVQKTLSLEVGKDVLIQVAGKQRSEIKKDYSVKAEKIQLEAEKEINLKTGKAEIIMKKNGDITIKGGKINVKGSGNVTIKGSKIAEN